MWVEAHDFGTSRALDNNFRQDRSLTRASWRYGARADLRDRLGRPSSLGRHEATSKCKTGARIPWQGELAVGRQTSAATDYLVSHVARERRNHEHVAVLRERIVRRDGRVVLFLGAGLSFGASRRGRKSLAEKDVWGSKSYGDGDAHEVEVILNDDDEPFPTWSRLKSRMRKRLAVAREQDQRSLNRFFRSSDPIDCAQLFRKAMGDPNYFEFLRSQFKPPSPVDYWITPSHEELVDLDLPLIFTTNYDDLIERAYIFRSKELITSSTADEYLAHRNPTPERHLIKIHGTIDRPGTVVLTRDDYARARVERRRIYQHLRLDVEQTTYLFIGFSLADPNVNVLLDDARLETGGELPPSYTVQGEYDPATDVYYRSLGINVIWIDSWDFLPSFLRAINPQRELPTGTEYIL